MNVQLPIGVQCEHTPFYHGMGYLLLPVINEPYDGELQAAETVLADRAWTEGGAVTPDSFHLCHEAEMAVYVNDNTDPEQRLVRWYLITMHRKALMN